MNKRINVSTASGIVCAPPSKSYAHRMLISAALTNELCVISNIELSNDITATLNALNALGYNALYDKKNKQVTIAYTGNKTNLYDCLESGSTLRFMIPIVLAKEGMGTFTGTTRLLARGLGIYEDIFNANNIEFKKAENSISINGKLPSGKYVVKGNVSSQFISGLLFSLPLLKEDSEIEIIPPIESIDYIKITIDVLRMFAIEIEDDLPNNKILIKGNQLYQQRDSVVEGDYSNAAFLDAFNYLGGNVLVNGLNKDSLQGDKAYLNYFNILKNEVMPTIDISNTIDLGPILFTMAALLNGAIFTGINRLRIKESDRVKCVCDELVKFGVESKISKNECIIYKNELHKPTKNLSSHNDHRLVMALSVILSKFGGVIENAEAVNKSFPNFFEVIKDLGIEVQDE